MSKKPRNKKYNPERNYARVAKFFVKPLAVTYTLGNSPLFVDAAKKRVVPVTETLYRAFHTVQHQWTVYAVVMLENSLGERYIKPIECAPERPCYKDDITDPLHEAHIKHIKTTKKADRVNIGWVAFPIKCDVSEKEIVELLEMHDDCWTRYERGKLELDDERSIEDQLKQYLSNS